MSDKGVGAAITRKEDARFLQGRGEFVGDIRLDRMKEVAFLRSPLAHARIRAIIKPPGTEGRIFTALDLAGVKPIRAMSGLPGYKAADWPVLAQGKVRFAGECMAMCVAETRAEAEDLAEQIELDLEELPAVTDMLESRKPGSPLLFEAWGDNVALHTFRDDTIEAVAATAPVVVNRRLRLARHAQVPMEGKGVLAYWDNRADQLICISSTQIPHLIRSAVATAIGLEERQVRVIPPDVGGGFGYKCVVQPEEIAISWLAIHLRHPVRWTEDRYEHLSGGANAREHCYDMTFYTDERGKILALDAEVVVDGGAYSVWPSTSTLEAAQAGGNLLGPYEIDCYRVNTYTMVTNKPPLAPYRSVARTGVCFAMDVMMDIIGREVGRDPVAIRLENMITADQLPYMNLVGKHYDSGDYPAGLRRAAELMDIEAVRERQRRGEPDGRLIGLGFASYVAQTAHGTSVFKNWGIDFVPGYEQATARLTADGGLELRIGAQCHGQGMETTMAQVANEILGVDPDRVSLVHGDTALTPFSIGTIASRCMVMAGGAVSRACKVLAERVAPIGAHLMQCSTEEVTVRDAKVIGPAGEIDFAEIGRVWYLHPEELPEDVDRGGLEVTAGYRPEPDSGEFSYATNAALVAVDAEIGTVELLDYLAVEDCGRMVNPLIVAGQVMGGSVQGIGTALFEEMPYSETGQPLATTFLDYTMPGTAELPSIRVEHIETPSPWTEFGIKGVGEGGAISPPAAIANAINDALKSFGAEVRETPMTRRRVLRAIEAAREAQAGAAPGAAE